MHIQYIYSAIKCTCSLWFQAVKINILSIASLIILFLYFSAHAITLDVNIADTAKAAEFFLSDGVIVTGSQTGQAADVSELIG